MTPAGISAQYRAEMECRGQGPIGAAVVRHRLQWPARNWYCAGGVREGLDRCVSQVLREAVIGVVSKAVQSEPRPRRSQSISDRSCGDRVFAPQSGHKAAHAIRADNLAPLAAAKELGFLRVPDQVRTPQTIVRMADFNAHGIGTF